MSCRLLASISIAAAAAAAGCADSIRPDGPDAALVDAPGLTPTGTVTTGDNGDGTFTTLVDATALSAWIHVDFETRAEVPESGPWDLRYQRFHISTNGGSSGAGGVEVARIAGATLAQVTAAPPSGWVADAPDGDDANTDPDYAFEQGDGWYGYNPATHVLTPRPLVWIVKTNGGSTIKLAIQRYYDSAGTPAWFTFQWAPL